MFRTASTSRQRPGPSDYDARHRFVINTIYQLPFSGNAFAEGWQIGGIVQAQTGNPVNIVSNVGTFNGVVNTLRPDLIGTITSMIDRERSGSTTRCAIRASPASLHARRRCLRCRSPADGTFHFGNLARNAVYGPGIQQRGLVGHRRTRALAGDDAAAAPARDLQPVQHRRTSGQPGRIVDGRQHELRRDHEHALPDGRLGLGAAGAVRGEVPLLKLRLPAVAGRREGGRFHIIGA